MKKGVNSIVIILGIIVIAVIAYFIFIGNKEATNLNNNPVVEKVIKNENYVDPAYPEKCNNFWLTGTPKSQLVLDCYTFVAEQKKDYKICDAMGEVVDSDYRNSCYLPAIISRGEASDCAKFGTDYPSKSKCYYELALISKDVNLCANTSNSYLCYSEIARLKNDEIPCYWNIDETEKQKCLGIVRLDASLCNADYGCLSKIAKIKGNISICDQIKNMENKEYCIVGVKPNENTCPGLESNSMKDLCYFILANSTDNPQFCNSIKYVNFNGLGYFQEVSKDSCFNYLAIKLKNAGLCNSIKVEQIKYSCDWKLDIIS